MDLTPKRRIYDLKKPEDRVYLLKRGFVWAVIYPQGEKRGKLISAHRDEKGVKFILNYLKDVKVDVVKIADYPDNVS
jgi:2-C-methyl-D-erythritol 4-phosphate cytidylyltransferase